MLGGGEVVVCNRPQVLVNSLRLQAQEIWVSVSLYLLIPIPEGQAGAVPRTDSLVR